MPPSPAYSWFCVLCTTANILSHAARHRASQVAPRTAVCLQHQGETRSLDSEPFRPPRPNVTTGAPRHSSSSRKYPEERASPASTKPEPPGPSVPEVKPEPLSLSNKFTGGPGDAATSRIALMEDVVSAPIDGETLLSPPLIRVAANFAINSEPLAETILKEPELESNILSSLLVVSPTDTPVPRALETAPQEFIVPTRHLQSSKVPSSRIGRLFHYGGLAASLGYGAASEIIRRTSGSNDSQSSVFMTEANIKRLVSKLSQMRGAALKLGQFLSIQDTHVLPAEIDQIFRRVQDSAHYMPDWQMQKVMISSLGPDWAKSFDSFERLPFAAASIGQVHGAILSASASPTGRPEPVAVKIQFPNIVNSIDSDLSYIKVLLTAGRLLPKGLFLDRSVQVLKEELADECNYTREASFLTAFGSPSHLGNDKRFKVPWVWKGSTDSVLVMERVQGTSVGDADTSGLNQKDRDDIAAWILELCLKELFEFRAMQTDPNWSNFLWNAKTRQVELVDFGATRQYSKDFIDSWLRLLQAAASEDREACVEWSLKLGYLTGEEEQVMLDAHVNSMILLAMPFRSSTPQPFSFGQDSAWAEITSEIRAQIPIMLTHRLTPPPRETYSLNRKLSGTFLLASRLGATVDTKTIWDRVVSQYQFN